MKVVANAVSVIVKVILILIAILCVYFYQYSARQRRGPARVSCTHLPVQPR